MKKTLLSILTITTLGFGLNAQNVNIPDPNFKSYLLVNNGTNPNGDNEIQVSEATAFTGTMNVSSANISDLTGIEAFTSLTVLICGNNLLTTLDLSSNTALLELHCANNQLTSLDLSACTQLTKIKCFTNALPTLNVSNCTQLAELDCYINQLSTLDLSNNVALTSVSCQSNLLGALDLSPNINLIEVQCNDNSLTSLNVANGNNTNFTWMGATGNPNLECVQVDDVAYSIANWDGTYGMIDVTASYSLNCSAVGIGEQENNITLSIYPNPVSNQLILDLDEKIEIITIMDIKGKEVKKLTPANNIVDVSNLTIGIYFLQIQTDKGLVSKKFIKE